MNGKQKSNFNSATGTKILFLLICNTPLLLLDSRNSSLSGWE
jgi:hypothetical protein